MSLRFSLSPDRPAGIDADAVVLGVHEDKSLPAATAEVDNAAGGAIRRLLDAGDVSGKPGTVNRLFHLAGVKAPRVLLVGLGEPRKFDAARYHKACTEAAKALASGPSRRVASFLPEVELAGRDVAWRSRQAAVAADAACYRYTATVKPKNGAGLEELLLPEAAGETVLAQARGIAAGVALARELGNLPPNICNPGYLADTARRIAAEETGVTAEVLERDEMAAPGHGRAAGRGAGQRRAAASGRAALAAAAGEAARTCVLVGKGITFDTGGISSSPPTAWRR